MNLEQILSPQRLTSVVDIGANPIDGVPPYKPLLDRGLCKLIGFEPQQEPLKKLNELKGPLERYLPTAIADGSHHTLHVCRASGMTSLLEPNKQYLQLFSDFPGLATTVTTEPVATKRLDDVDEIDSLDFLKVDAQGAEFDIIRYGRSKLAATVAIHIEVRFITFYHNEAPIGIIDTELRSFGLIPHCFVSIKRWPIAPVVIDSTPRKPLHQILGADMLYVKDFSRFENMSAEQWKHLAIIAHYCYGSIDLTYRALAALVSLGAIRPDGTTQYLENLKKAAETKQS